MIKVNNDIFAGKNTKIANLSKYRVFSQRHVPANIIKTCATLKVGELGHLVLKAKSKAICFPFSKIIFYEFFGRQMVHLFEALGKVGMVGETGMVHNLGN